MCNLTAHTNMLTHTLTHTHTHTTQATAADAAAIAARVLATEEAAASVGEGGGPMDSSQGADAASGIMREPSGED